MVHVSSSTISTTRLRAQLLSATRHVKSFCKSINPPRHGSHGRLQDDKMVCLKTSHQSRPCRSSKSPFSNLAVYRNKIRKFLKTCRSIFLLYYTMWQSRSMFTLPDSTSAMQLITLTTPLQTFYTPWPNHSPQTLTNPLLPHPTDVANIHLRFT